MAKLYLLDKNTPLTGTLINKIISNFSTYTLPKYNKYKNYYDGNLAILLKFDEEKRREYNKIVTNYCYNIVHNYLGYISGKPIKYENDYLEELTKILNYNDTLSEDNLYLKNALIYGSSFEICYIDEDGKQRFKVLDTRNCIPVYTDDLDGDLLYLIRFWEVRIADELLGKYYVEVYDNKTVKKYLSNSSYSSFNLIEEYDHHYNQVPITVFELNSDKESIFALIMTMQDAYNELVSGEIDSYQDFSDAYLLLSGCGLTDDQLESFKKNRFMSIDTDCKASFITKNVNDTQVLDIQQKINDNIHKISCSPDFNDDKFMAQSGVAMKFKLVAFENQSANIECNMKKALLRRLELLCSVLNLTNYEDIEHTWRDVNIIFTRNLPTELTDTTQMVNSLRGLVSDRTLLSQIPFVYDIDREEELLKRQKFEDVKLYDFTKEVINE